MGTRLSLKLGKVKGMRRRSGAPTQLHHALPVAVGSVTATSLVAIVYFIGEYIDTHKDEVVRVFLSLWHRSFLGVGAGSTSERWDGVFICALVESREGNQGWISRIEHIIWPASKNNMADQ